MRFWCHIDSFFCFFEFNMILVLLSLLNQGFRDICQILTDFFNGNGKGKELG